jgi:hypothetical protein
LAHGFRDFSSQSFGTIAFGPVVRQNIMVVGMCGRGTGSKEREEGTRDQVQAARPHFLKLPPPPKTAGNQVLNT